MKCLWLCNVMSSTIARNLKLNINNFGGWVSSALDPILKDENNQIFYLFPYSNSLSGTIANLNFCSFNNKQKPQLLQKTFTKIVEEFNPDIIHIWGTEFRHSNIMVHVAKQLNVIDKVVINIQGLVTYCEKVYNAFLPNNVVNGFTLRDFVRHNNIALQKKDFYKRSLYEQNTLQLAQNVVGRTDWDQACVKIANPQINYFFCNESLRKSFYESTWEMENIEKHSIFISQSNYPLKGFHLMLDAFKEIVKKYPDAKLYTTGKDLFKRKKIIDKLKLTYYDKYLLSLIKKYNLIKNVIFLGTLNEAEMCQRYLKSHIFVSPSVLENSSNSIGEAMLLGVPTIASDVGGVKNMLNHNVDGFLYPSDEPYMIFYYVDKIFKDDELALNFSKNAQKNAKKIFNVATNQKMLMRIYGEIIDGKNI